MSLSKSSSSAYSKPKPCYSNLPWFIKQRIVDNTDLITRLRLRKVSKECIYYVERSQFTFEDFSLVVDKKLVTLKIVLSPQHEITVDYRKAHHYLKSEDSSYTVGCPDHIKRALKDASILLRSPKITVKMLEFAFKPDYQKKSARNKKSQFLIDWALFHETFQTEFQNLTLNVRDLMLDFLDEDEILGILSHLKSRTLNGIQFYGPSVDVKFNRLVETDQWKFAERISCPGITNILKMTHFREGMVNDGSVTIDEFKQLLQLFQENPTFSYFFADVRYNYDDFHNYIMQFPQRNPNFDGDRFIPIPNTDHFMKINLVNRLGILFVLEKLSKEDLYKDDDEHW